MNEQEDPLPGLNCRVILPKARQLTDCLHFSVSPAGKPRQCTHVRPSTSRSSPSRSERYSAMVSVISNSSRLLRIGSGILDSGRAGEVGPLSDLELKGEMKTVTGKVFSKL